MPVLTPTYSLPLRSECLFTLHKSVEQNLSPIFEATLRYRNCAKITVLMCEPGADLGGGCRGCAPPPHPPKMTCGFLIKLVFCQKKKTRWFIGVEVEQETSAPPPKKNPGSTPVNRSPIWCMAFVPAQELSGIMWAWAQAMFTKSKPESRTSVHTYKNGDWF